MNSSVVRPLSSIEDLPLDVIAIITKYFKLKDLAACCAVSHRMREVFGDDILWRRHCDDPDVAEYLRTTACKVEPVFVSPETGDNSNMSPICYWRMAFMREKHLWNNWRHDKFKREVLKGESHHKLSPLILGFLSNDFVMLVTKTKIHILDVRYYPAAEAVEPIDLNFVTQDTFFLRIHGQNNMIVILYLGSVLVYHLEFCTQQSILNYMFLFEDSEKLIPSEYEQALNIRRNQSCNIKMFHLVEGKYFVGILPEVLVIHVWDLEKGIKLKAESLPIDKGSVQAIKGFGTGVVGIAIEDIDESTKIRCFLAFSLTNLCFLPFKKTGTRHDEFYVDKNSIIICRPQTYNMPRCPHLDLLWMWNQLCCTPTPHSPVQPIGNKFVFIHNKDSCLTLVDPDNEYFKLPLVTGIRLYQVLSKRIIQVQRQSGFEVWELDGPWFLKTIAATSGCGRIISVNKASSRCIVILGKVTAVLHYW